jgi:hypothetical protein
MRKSFIAFLVLAALLPVGIAYGSIAATPGAMFQPTGTTIFKLSDYENVYDVNGNLLSPGAQITAGDTLSGIFLITSSSTPGGANQLTPGNFQLAGLFSARVASVSTNPVDGNGNFAFQLTPDAAFGTKVGVAGAMAAIYVGPANQFNAATGSLATVTNINSPAVAAAYASVTNGATLWQVGGAAPGQQTWGTDYYWAAVGSGSPGVSSFAADLQLLLNNTGIAMFGNLAQQSPSSYPTTSGLGVPALDWTKVLNPIALQGNTRINTDAGTIPFQIASQDPLSEAPIVPEPTGMLVMGGLFGLWGIGLAVYRRMRKA